MYCLQQLLLTVELHSLRGVLLFIKFSCAGDLSVFIRVPCNKRQYGLFLPVAGVSFPVDLSDTDTFPTPGEIGCMGQAGVVN